jgi:adhesin HecA-like repeat protein
MELNLTNSPLNPINSFNFFSDLIKLKLDEIGSSNITSSIIAASRIKGRSSEITSANKFTNISEYYGSDYLFIKLGLTKSQFFAQLSAAAEKLRLEKEEEEKIIRLAKEAEEQKLTEEEKKRRAAESEQIRLANQSNQKLLQPAHFLGDSFTESKLLKEQLSSIRKDAMMLNENEQGGEEEIKSLLDNTATELKKLNLTLAEVATKGLTQSQINSLEKDIITFESTNLNGMNIIVPKIYLSLKTRDKLLGSSTATSSLAHSAENLMSSGSLLTSSTIFAKGDLTLNSPTATLLNSGSIISGKNMTLNLASLRNQTNSSQVAEIKSGGNLEITAFAAEGIKNLGAKILTTNDLRLTTLRGNILNSSLVQTNDAALLNSSLGTLGGGDSYQLRFADAARTSGNITSNLISSASLTAKNIEINSANNFTNLAAKISSGEDLSIEAGGDINIATLQLHNRTEEHWGNKKSGGDRIIDTTTNLQSEISSSGNIKINSGNDTTLQAAKLTAGENIDITAGNPPSPEGYGRTGNLLLLTAQNTSFKMESIRKNKTFTFKNNDNGFVNSEVLNNEITVGEAVGDRRQAVGEGDGQTGHTSTELSTRINLTAQNTAYVEFKSGTDSTQNIQSQLQNLKAETILTNPIDEIHKSWNKTNSGLNQTGMIAVAIVATATTGGAALAYAPAAMGVWATVGYSVGTAVASSAATTFSTSAINTSIDGGNFNQISKQAFKDTTSKESFESMAIAAATAALVAGASQATNASNASNITSTANTANTTASTLERVATNFATGLQKATIYSTSNILATSAIKGQSIGETIEQQGGGEKILLNTALNALAETGANEIGIAAHAGEINKATQLTLHGVIGCAIGSTSGNCAAGAAGAIAGEIAGEKYFKSKLDKHNISEVNGTIQGNNIYLDPSKTDLTLNELTKIKLQTVELSKVIGAFAAVPFAGDDDASAVYAGSNASRNAVENNSLDLRGQYVAGEKIGKIHLAAVYIPKPDNQALYEGDDRFKRDPKSGKLYMTIGGGTDEIGGDIFDYAKSSLARGEFPKISEALNSIKLYGNSNRDRDLNLSIKIYQSQNLVPVEQEAHYANLLYQLNQNYQDNLGYTLFPKVDNERYNSNSYISGILNAAGIAPPDLPNIKPKLEWQDLEYPEYSPNINVEYTFPFPAPGYDRPVPPQYFEPNQKRFE